MKYERIKYDRWEITKTEEGQFSLFYEPGIIEETGALIKINEEVFNAAKKGVTLKELYKEFSLYNNERLYTVGKPVTPPSKINTANQFYGRGFIATQEGNKYFLEYQLARHGGGSRKFEITKEIYEDARKGDKSTSDLFKKYNLYHLDVPENDVNE